MSMWDIESLIEDGVRLVGKATATNEEKIKLIGNLYAIQKQFDCSFTNFRVIEILLNTGYTITIDYTEHPDYKGNEAFFERLLLKDDISFVYRDIKQEWSEENDMVAYIERESRKIYIDYGSPLRKDDAPLELVNVFALGRYLIREAHQRQQKELVYDWTAFLLKIGPGFLDKKITAEEVISEYLEEIKQIWASYDFSDYDPLSDTLTITDTSEETKEFIELLISMGGLKGKLLEWFRS